ncbi:putative lisH domain-containing protein C1711.05-like [Scophthalmus maximus]|uniref:Putative lisH domain-containing protein C1711.05-like n=1 Tax=Scophthalmus maximus TaxID=52904 RepID=A0A2U9BTB4_SCOMX|nr:putative lisH domain-containing protein C1711.05-like [Scophthalmus maximus]
MPIASGAAGRVDVGGDASATTWTPDGLKTNPKPTNRNCDSYLQRYKELKESKKNKSNLSQVTPDNTDASDRENDGANEGSPLKNGGGERVASGKPSRGDRSQKSRTCVLL